MGKIAGASYAPIVLGLAVAEVNQSHYDGLVASGVGYFFSIVWLLIWLYEFGDE